VKTIICIQWRDRISWRLSSAQPKLNIGVAKTKAVAGNVKTNG